MCMQIYNCLDGNKTILRTGMKTTMLTGTMVATMRVATRETTAQRTEAPGRERQMCRR